MSEEAKKLQKQFEDLGYCSWINSEIYPDGKIYTKEYTEWIEEQLIDLKQKNEKLIEFLQEIEKEYDNLSWSGSTISKIKQVIENNKSKQKKRMNQKFAKAASEASHMTAREQADLYQDFFNFLSQEHNLICTIEEMDEIIHEAQAFVKKL